MFWRIYTVLYLLIIIVVTLFLIPTIGSWNFASWKAITESILLAIGVFVFAYKKNLLNRSVWKFVFNAILLFWTADIIFYTTNLQLLSFLEVNEYDLGAVALLTFVSLPALVAIYKIGYPKENS